MTIAPHVMLEITILGVVELRRELVLRVQQPAQPDSFLTTVLDCLEGLVSIVNHALRENTEQIVVELHQANVLHVHRVTLATTTKDVTPVHPVHRDRVYYVKLVTRMSTS